MHAKSACAERAGVAGLYAVSSELRSARFFFSLNARLWCVYVCVCMWVVMGDGF